MIFFGSFWSLPGASGSSLGASWVPPEALLGRLGPPNGASWSVSLELLWALGRLLEHPGASRSTQGAFFGGPGWILDVLGAPRAPLLDVLA